MLTDGLMAQLRPYLAKSYGSPRVNDQSFGNADTRETGIGWISDRATTAASFGTTKTLDDAIVPLTVDRMTTNKPSTAAGHAPAALSVVC